MAMDKGKSGGRPCLVGEEEVKERYRTGEKRALEDLGCHGGGGNGLFRNGVFLPKNCTSPHPTGEHEAFQ